MEVEQIIDLLLNRLNELGLWFTAKTDPTYMEPSSYYELDIYGDPTEKSKKKIAKEIESLIGDGAVTIEDAIELWIFDAEMAFTIAFKECIVTKYEPKPVVPGLDAYENSVQLAGSEKGVKTENVKRRLKEENNRSSDAITAKMQDPDFDADSADGKIVLKTSELFNNLADKGYNVQVSFDNGESQSTILLGQTGANATITITNGNDPIKAFVSGNFLLDTDIVNQLNQLEKDINY